MLRNIKISMEFKVNFIKIILPEKKENDYDGQQSIKYKKSYMCIKNYYHTSALKGCFIF